MNPAGPPQPTCVRNGTFSHWAAAPRRWSLAALALIGTLVLAVWTTNAVVGRGLADGSAGPHIVQHPRVIVLKSKRTLHLFDGDRLVRTYPVALGYQPTGQKHHAGDGCTPEGWFRICSRNPQSKYHRFLGLDYPDPRAAQNGLREGLITFGEFRDIIAAHAQQRCPSWSTGLGGGIGLHGHGTAGDWTAGCIALDDADIEELFGVLRVGDVVEILP